MEEIPSTEYLEKTESNSSKQEKTLLLPKFKIETEIQPIENIKKLGYIEMFSNNADFSKISHDEKLQIGTIVHKTFIEVDKKRTEAAAVIEIVMAGFGTLRKTPPVPPRVFNANHLFVFLIKDNSTNSIIFIGRFVE